MCKNKEKKKNYLNDGAKLIALVSHLATTEYRSGTIKGIADRTSLDKDDVEILLKKYNELFVKVPYHPKTEREDKTPYYTLHLRFGHRRGDEEADCKPLDAGHISILINTIQHSMDIEHQRKSLLITNIITMIAAIVAALAALSAAIIAANINNPTNY